MPNDTPSPADRIQTVTVERQTPGWNAIILEQFATIRHLQAEVKALRAVIAEHATAQFLETHAPTIVTYTLQGVTHRVIVYADDDHLIHTVEV